MAIAGLGTRLSASGTRLSRSGSRLSRSGVRLSVTNANIPSGSLFYADFINGNYWWNGSSKIFSDLTFSRSTTATFVDKFDGLVKIAAINTARFETTGYLTEAAATNLGTQSEDFSVNSSVTNITVATNVTTSPDGANTADRITRSSTASSLMVKEIITKAASAINYTLAVYAKADSANFIALRMLGAGANLADVCFDLSNGTVSTAATATGFTNPVAGVIPLSNGWYRVWLSATSDTTLQLRTVFSPRATTGIAAATDTSSTASVFVWGYQAEQGFYPSSYIPTTTAQVTRGADSLTLTLASAGITLPSGGFTLFGQFNRSAFGTNNFPWQYALDDTTTNNRLGHYHNRSISQLATININATVNQWETGYLSGIGQTTPFRTAQRYQNNNFAICGNGGAVSSSVTPTVPTVTRLAIGFGAGGANMNGMIGQVAIFDTPYSNAQLQALTA